MGVVIVGVVYCHHALGCVGQALFSQREVHMAAGFQEYAKLPKHDFAFKTLPLHLSYSRRERRSYSKLCVCNLCEGVTFNAWMVGQEDIGS